MWLVDALAAVGWSLVVVGYFVTFWSTVGQTPGMRLMRVRVVSASGDAPSGWRSLVRLIGLALAVILLFTGFLPALVDGRRRALAGLHGRHHGGLRHRGSPAVSARLRASSLLESRWDEVGGVQMHAQSGRRGAAGGARARIRRLGPLHASARADPRLLLLGIRARPPGSRTKRAVAHAARDRRPCRRARGLAGRGRRWSGRRSSPTRWAARSSPSWRCGDRSGSARWCWSAPRSTRAGAAPATRSSARCETRRTSRRCWSRSRAGSGPATWASSGPSRARCSPTGSRSACRRSSNPRSSSAARRTASSAGNGPSRPPNCYRAAASSSSPASRTPSPIRIPACSPGSSRS